MTQKGARVTKWFVVTSVIKIVVEISIYCTVLYDFYSSVE